jgi:hypothetical protein
VTAVRFERRNGITAVTFAYHPRVVAIIKDIPSFARSWNPARREWLILDDAWALMLAAMLSDAGHTIIGLDPPTHRDDIDSAAWARAVLQRVGPTRAALAYKLLSRVCHPDHGGDHQLQLELNQAYAELPPNERRSA